MIKTDKAKVLKVIGIICLAVLLCIFLFFAISRFVIEVKESVQVFRQAAELQQAIDDISAGTIYNKEIINGYKTSNGGVAYNPTTGNYGYIVGGNNDYVPTRYRIYVLGEYEYNGETHQAEVYFDVDAEIYAAYKIGDYFDSRNPMFGSNDDLEVEKGE